MTRRIFALCLLPWILTGCLYVRASGSFGPSLDRDPLGPGNRAAADRRGVRRNGSGQGHGQLRVMVVKVEKVEHGFAEFVGVLDLCPGASLAT